MYSTQLRTLLLVVMAMLWVTSVRAEPDCRFNCRLQNMTFPLEREDCNGSVTIPICAGLCVSKDENYFSHRMPLIQEACNFNEWSYEEFYLESCPPGADPFLIPVVKSCHCSICKESAFCDSWRSPTTTSC